MSRDFRSYALSDLSWVEVEAHLSRDPRLILPVGVCDQFGPHLPTGAATIITEALAHDLSQEFRVLRAPTLHYGINVSAQRSYPGAAGLGIKTLHRAINELLGGWEAAGVTELITITAHSHDPHVEALATVFPKRARVRVVDALAVDLAKFLDGPPSPQHGGEVVTSLLLHLKPDRVQSIPGADFLLDPEHLPRFILGRLPTLPSECPGSVGLPSLASADKGCRIYAHVLQKIRERIFLAPVDDFE